MARARNACQGSISGAAKPPLAHSTKETLDCRIAAFISGQQGIASFLYSCRTLQNRQSVVLIKISDELCVGPVEAALPVDRFHMRERLCVSLPWAHQNGVKGDAAVRPVQPQLPGLFMAER